MKDCASGNGCLPTPCIEPISSLSAPLSRFEELWRQLRGAGHLGWGGSSFDARLKGWRTDLRHPMVDRFMAMAPRNVLDLGCGTGHVGAIMAADGHHVTGIDFSPTAINWARECWADSGLALQFHQLHAGALSSLGKARFDFVIDTNCLHCLVGEERLRALTGIRTVLRHSGIAMISSMVLPLRALPKDLCWVPEQNQIYLDGAPWRRIAELDELLNELRDVGLEPIAVENRERSWWNHALVIAGRPGASNDRHAAYLTRF